MRSAEVRFSRFVPVHGPDVEGNEGSKISGASRTHLQPTREATLSEFDLLRQCQSIIDFDVSRRVTTAHPRKADFILIHPEVFAHSFRTDARIGYAALHARAHSNATGD
jgi:hypothetical protein